MVELLRTKLHIPQQRPNHLLRPALLKRLDEGLWRPLTVIAAPAGFGKSTLAAAWLFESPAIRKLSPAPHIGWFTVDATDNDPKRFMAYLAAAFTCESAVTGDTASSLEAELIPLLNQLATVDRKQILVFDDYHHIANEVIDQALTFLIEHAPSTLHLCITSRVDPNLPLHRWRARQQLTELRARELRFTTDESTQFLQEILHLPLSAADINELDSHTEGWITALQMVAQSLAGRSEADIRSFVHGFRGSHRFVLDYLVDEVLAQQPPHLQQFLLQTAILDRLCAPLCDALLRPADSKAVPQTPKALPVPALSASSSPSQQLLEELEAKNLFTFALDDERRWFRYHHLFADFLRLHLQENAPTVAGELHRRAATWFAEAGLMDEAIDHALQGDATDQAAAWVAQIASTLLQRGELLTLKRLIGKLPAHYVEKDYRLALAQAWAATAVMDHQDPEPDFARMTQLIEEAESLDSARRADLIGQVLVMRTTWAVSLNQVADALHYGQLALTQLPANSPVMRNLITLQLGNAYRVQGDVSAAIVQYQAICRQGAAVNDALVIYITHFHYARLLRLQGELDAAQAICEAALRINSQLQEPTLLIGLANVGKAELLWERWELGAAQTLAEQALEECRLAGMTEGITFAYHLLARIHFTRGQPAAAEAMITTAEPYLQNIKEADGNQWAKLYALRYAIYRNDLPMLQRQINQAHRSIHQAPMAIDLRGELLIVIAWGYLCLGQPDESIRLVEEEWEAAVDKATLLLLDRLVIRAIAYHMSGATAVAENALTEALNQAMQTGQRRPFVVYSKLAEPLWNALNSDLQEQIARFVQLPTPPSHTTPPQPSLPSPTGAHSALRKDTGQLEPVEALSDREREVLQLIADGLRNKEIADTLVVSLNTIRYHTKNIYGKLGVNSRTQAVAVAKELGLLNY